MKKELYSCDRPGCTNTTELDGSDEFAYATPGWVGIKLKGSYERAQDYCSLECAAIELDKLITKKREA
jgi:hypothetical protein